MSNVEKRLSELGLTVPDVAAPLAAYVPAVSAGDLIFSSGQIPSRDGQLLSTGKVGGEVALDDAIACAQQCALNAIAAVKSLVGDLDRVAQVVKVVAYVASTPDFVAQPKVADGASELLGAAFGERGSHARSAVGVPVLPLDVPVEVEIVVRLGR